MPHYGYKSNNKNNKRKIDLKTFILFFFILIQILLFLVFINSFDGYAIDYQYDNNYECVNTIEGSCEDINSELLCRARRDCIAIKGHHCHGNSETEVFVECASHSSIKSTKKIELERKIPDWMITHPDHSEKGFICAHPPNSRVPFLRFPTKYIPKNWVQDKCIECCVKPKPINHYKEEDTKLTVTTLVWKEFDSFNNSLHTWIHSGLLDYADEFIVFINEKRAFNDPIEVLINQYVSKFKLDVKILSNRENVGIGKGLAQLVLNSRNHLVLFLEKDWEIVEPYEVLKNQLDNSKALILSDDKSSRADVVKLRSRFNAGEPNIDRQLCVPPFWDEEDEDGLSMWSQYRQIPGTEDHEWWLPHLFCNIYHFDKDPQHDWPNRMWPCGCDNGFLCYDSAQCGWTNNPVLFKKSWWIDVFYYLSQNEENTSFEGGTYYSPEWILPHWVVAQGDGFYRHHEINEHM
eukprot:TRINITY_DN685_c0_g3_i1.p1 TRINITY_DN685_c0_g3~~TRINITY_DN685_c0_g3_i1.p1  ORF type:complete len:462 (-),score=113.48 TRINITY_DN685_c0_g3_i1:103-1488(-)